VGEPLFCGSAATFCFTSGACCLAILSWCLFCAAFTNSSWNSGDETLRFAKNAEAAAFIGARCGRLSSTRLASLDGAGLFEVCALVLNRRVFFGAPEPVSSHPVLKIKYVKLIPYFVIVLCREEFIKKKIYWPLVSLGDSDSCFGGGGGALYFFLLATAAAAFALTLAAGFWWLTIIKGACDVLKFEGALRSGSLPPNLFALNLLPGGPFFALYALTGATTCDWNIKKDEITLNPTDVYFSYSWMEVINLGNWKKI